MPVDRIEPNPESPRLAFDEAALEELAASIKEHGVLQPVLVRPRGREQYQLVAGERRWRAAKAAGLETIPALIEEHRRRRPRSRSPIIENLQREDLSPLEEACIYDRMVRSTATAIRKLAQKLGKDKGYLENRLRLADAPEEVRELVSLRKDTLSHAYELMKVEDPRKRRRLAQQVARGELSLVKLRERIEGRPVAPATAPDDDPLDGPAAASIPTPTPQAPVPAPVAAPSEDDALVTAKAQLHDALAALVAVLRSPEFDSQATSTDRQNLAKYLTISKLTLENAITVARGGAAGRDA